MRRVALLAPVLSLVATLWVPVSAAEGVIESSGLKSLAGDLESVGSVAISGELLRAAALSEAGISIAELQASTPVVTFKQELVEVELRFDSYTEAALATAQATGLVIDSRHPDVGFVTGRIPLSGIEGLSTVEGLATVHPLYGSTVSTGSVTNQADTTMHAKQARNLAGVGGRGVEIGVISDSFDGGASGTVSGTGCNRSVSGTSSQLSGDLPGSVGVVADVFGGSDEGRGMAELIHDLAPKSTLTFHTGYPSEAGFAQAIRNLATCGADVIVDDLLYFAEPMFQDGVVAQAADDVALAGIPYFSSAGNQAGFGVNDIYKDRAPGASTVLGDDFHDFGGGDAFAEITLDPGEAIRIVFQWNDPFDGSLGDGASSDYDIGIFDTADTSSFLTSSATAQGCAFGSGVELGDPLEVVDYINNKPTRDSVFVVINRYCAGTGGGNHLRLATFGLTAPVTSIDFESDIFTDFQQYGHAAAANVMSVAAVFYGEADNPSVQPPNGRINVEDFSSLGGDIPIYFDRDGQRLTGGPQLRSKPDISAVDGTNTSFFGDDIGFDPDGHPNFFGTSAAAPHAAAVAALVLEANPGALPEMVYDVLEATAIDIEANGVDDLSGHGLIDALGAIKSCRGLPATLVGTPGNDTLNGTAGPDVIVSFGGNDVVNGRLGDDVICLGAGNDVGNGEGGNDTIYGDAGWDELFGGAKSDTLDGGAGRDTLDGEWGSDSLTGGTGHDSLTGGPGNDSLNGGGGNDVLIGNAGSDLLIGGGGADTLRGGSQDDDLRGNNGKDILNGQGGNDYLHGGNQDDELRGAAGSDVMLGAAGHDTMYGAAGNDDLRGGQGDDTIYAGDGDDLLLGQAGTDTMYGGNGNDEIGGGLGDDSMFGGDDNDVLDGHGGIDTADGGNGEDDCTAEFVTQCEVGLIDFAFDRFLINQAAPAADSDDAPADRIEPVSGRPGIIRAFFTANEFDPAYTPTVKLHWMKTGGATGEIVLTGPTSLGTSAQEGDLADTHNLAFDETFLEAGMKFYVEVDGANEIEESNESNNRYPTSGWLDPNVTDVAPLEITFVPIGFDGGPAPVVTPSSALDLLEDTIDLHPVAAVDTQIHSDINYDTVGTADDWTNMLEAVRDLAIAEGSGRVYAGIVPSDPSGSAIAGIGYVNCAGCSVLPYTVNLPSPSTVAHDLGYNFGRRNVLCSGSEGDPDELYPYAGGSIGTWGYEADTGQLKDPATYNSFMSYCADAWVSDYTYGGVLDFRMSPTGFDIVEVPVGASAVSFSGSMAAPGASTLRIPTIGDPGARLDIAPSSLTIIRTPSRGDHQVVGLDAQGEVVTSATFSVHEIADTRGSYEAAHFAFVIAVDDADLTRIVRWEIRDSIGLVTARAAD